MARSPWAMLGAIVLALIMVGSALAVLSSPLVSNSASNPASPLKATAAVSSPSPSAASSLSAGKTLGINSALAASVKAGQERNHPPVAVIPRPSIPLTSIEAPPLSSTHGVVTPLYATSPAPMGVAYYGDSNTTGTTQATTSTPRAWRVPGRRRPRWDPGQLLGRQQHREPGRGLRGPAERGPHQCHTARTNGLCDRQQRTHGMPIGRRICSPARAMSARTSSGCRPTSSTQFRPTCCRSGTRSGTSPTRRRTSRARERRPWKGSGPCRTRSSTRSRQWLRVLRYDPYPFTLGAVHQHHSGSLPRGRLGRQGWRSLVRYPQHHRAEQ